MSSEDVVRKEEGDEGVEEVPQTGEICLTQKWRVKLYELTENGDWNDASIGFVYISQNQNMEFNINPPRLIMINETENEKIFDFEINSDIVFHYQNDTILMWKSSSLKADDDFALSFKQKEGIKEVKKLLDIHAGKDEKDDFIFASNTLSEVSINNLETTNKIIINQSCNTKNEKFISAILKNLTEFVLKLGTFIEEGEIIKQNEAKSLVSNETCATVIDDPNQNSSQPGAYLNLIFSIIKKIILLGNTSIIEKLMSDELYLITFGALEYDPEITQQKSPLHREYFKNCARFNNILKIEDKDIIDKIHLVHRCEYLIDVAIARFIEEAASTAILTVIQKNNMDIIQYLLQNEALIKNLFEVIKSNNDLKLKKDGCLFACKMLNYCRDNLNAKHLYEDLCDLGLISVIDNLINSIPSSEPYQIYINMIEKKEKTIQEKKENESDNSTLEVIKTVTIEMLMTLLAIVPEMIRDYILEKESPLVVELCKIMICQEKFGVQAEISQILKNFIDNDIQFQKTKIHNMLFNEALVVFIDFLKISPTKEMKKATTQTKQIIIEIMNYILTRYEKTIQYWLLENKLCDVILGVYKENAKFTTVQVIKFIKTVLTTTDIFFWSSFLNEKVVNILIDAFNKNKKRENLIFSCVLDLYYDLYLKNKKASSSLIAMNRGFVYGQENEVYFEKLKKMIENKEEEINPNIYGLPGSSFELENNEKDEDDDLNFENIILIGKKKSRDSDFEELLDSRNKEDEKEIHEEEEKVLQELESLGKNSDDDDDE